MAALGASATASLTRRLNRDGGAPEELMRDTMTKAAEVAMAFPRLRTRLDSPAATEYNATPDQAFELGFRALLNGLAEQRTAAN